MPRLSISACVVAICALACAAIFAPVASTQNRQANLDELSYAIGFDAGAFFLQTLNEDGLDFDIDSVLAGVEDALRQDQPQISRGAMQDHLERLEEELREQRAKTLAESDPVYRVIAAENLRASKEFHNQFAKSPGAVTLPSGVQYRVLRAGDGERIKADDTVILSFEARLIDSFEFAEADRQEFVVDEVMEGGQQALQRMRVGDKWLVAIPPELAFGELGKAPDVGPNETVIVEVEVHEIKGQ